MSPSHHISHTNTTRYLFMQHLLWELMYILSCHQISSYSSSYVTIFSYQIITDNNYTFSLAPWTDDARCQIQAWKVPVIIDIHGIPSLCISGKNLSALLDPFCTIETLPFVIVKWFSQQL